VGVVAAGVVSGTCCSGDEPEPGALDDEPSSDVGVVAAGVVSGVCCSGLEPEPDSTGADPDED
jgi:hypothetical protein